MNKKFHFLLTQDLASPSGLGRYLPWAKELAHLGYEVRISATHSNYKALKNKKIYINGVTVEYIGQMHILKDGATKKYFPLLTLVWNVIYATIMLTKAGISYPADVIIVGKPHPMNGIAGILSSKRWKSELIVDIDDDEENSGNFKSLWQKSIIGWFQKKLPQKANWVITNTQYMKQKLYEYGISPEKIFYLPNGIDPSRFQPISQEIRISLKKALRLSNQKVILYIGSISLVNHPLNLLIEAFESVYQLQSNVVLLLVGGGESIEDVRALVRYKGLSEKVLLVGKVPPEDVVKYYSIADVSVDPVYDDLAARGRCPLKLFESWLCEVPFITGDVGDRRWLAGNPPAIKICKPGDAKALASGILEVLNTKHLSLSLIQLGKEKVQAFYWGNLTPTFLRLLSLPMHIQNSLQD